MARMRYTEADVEELRWALDCVLKYVIHEHGQDVRIARMIRNRMNALDSCVFGHDKGEWCDWIDCTECQILNEWIDKDIEQGLIQLSITTKHE